MLPTAAPRRVQAVLLQLDRVASDYKEAKESFESARVEFEAAREKFASVKQLAAGMLTSNDWWAWQQQNQSVKYAAMPIGDAILESLREHTFAAAWRSVEGEQASFMPHCSMDELVAQLEAGGFDFRSSTPRREVNAALLNLNGVAKDGEMYLLDEADKMLHFVQSMHDSEMESRADPDGLDFA